MGDGRTQLKLTGLEPVNWLHPRMAVLVDVGMATDWPVTDMPCSEHLPKKQVSFHRDGTDGIVLMDVITTKPSRRSDQLNLTIEAVRPKDQRRLDALAANDLCDIVLWITEQPTSGMSMTDSYPSSC